MTNATPDQPCAQLTQVAMLMPKFEEKPDSLKPNLELSTKGIQAFLKLNLMQSEVNQDMRLQNIVKATMKTKRSLTDKDVSTDASDEGEKKKHDKKSKK